MKIGILSPALNSKMTGIGNYTKELIEGLSAKISDKDSLTLINYMKTPLQIGNELVLNNPFPVFKNHLFYPYSVNKLKQYDFDIIHNPHQVPTYFRFTQKNVITVHDLTPILFAREHPFGVGLYFKTLWSRTFKNADAIISVSKSTKFDLMKRYGVPENKIKVIYEAAGVTFKPLDIDSLKKFQCEHRLKFPFILYVGTLEPRKNLITLVKAFIRLKKNKSNYKLIIIGKKGWNYQRVLDLISDSIFSQDILFKEYVPFEDLPYYYNLAEVFVYPSLYEGFGLPPLEAMSCGCPVISSDISSIPEVVGDAGILINPMDENALVKSIQNVLDDENLQTEMKRKGILQSKKFSWNKCIDSTLDLYKSLI